MREHRLEIERLRIQLAQLRRWKFGRSREQLELEVTQIEMSLQALEQLAPRAAAADPQPDTQNASTPLKSGGRYLGVARDDAPAGPSAARDDHAPAPGGHERLCVPGLRCAAALPGAGRGGDDRVRAGLLQGPAPRAREALLRAVLTDRAGEGSLAPHRTGTTGTGSDGARGGEQVLPAPAAVSPESGVRLRRPRARALALAQWVRAGDRLLSPLVLAVRRYVLGGGHLHADDTPLPVLDPGRGRTRTGYLWTYVRDERTWGSQEPPAVWFEYSPGSGGQHPRRHLHGYQGVVHVDAYAGFNELFGLFRNRERKARAGPARLKRSLCFAHARRKLYEMHLALRSPIAVQAVERIDVLYAIEREIRGLDPEVRLRERQARSVPLLQELHTWLMTELARLPASSRSPRRSATPSSLGTGWL